MDKESIKLIESYVNQNIEKVSQKNAKELASLTRKLEAENKKLQKASVSNAQKVQRLEKLVAQHSRDIQHLEQKVLEIQNKTRTWGGK